MSKLDSADYTTLWHKIRNLRLEIPEKEGEMVVAVDATGIKVTNRANGFGDNMIERGGDGSRYMSLWVQTPE
ncbi:MAG: transposase [Candidatus Hadarchaeia archaeon]